MPEVPQTDGYLWMGELLAKRDSGQTYDPERDGAEDRMDKQIERLNSPDSARHRG